MARYLNPESEPHIRRLDGKNTHGFQFHVERGNLRLTRLFSDLISGSKDEAKHRARIFREATLPKFPSSQRSGPRSHTPNSNTGVMGVSITDEVNKDGSVRTYVEATARPPGGKIMNKKIRMYNESELLEIISSLTEWRQSILSPA